MRFSPVFGLSFMFKHCEKSTENQQTLKNQQPHRSPGKYTGGSFVGLLICENICVCVACVCSADSTKNKKDCLSISFVLSIRHFKIVFNLAYGTKRKCLCCAVGAISVLQQHFFNVVKLFTIRGGDRETTQ